MCGQFDLVVLVPLSLLILYTGVLIRLFVTLEPSLNLNLTIPAYGYDKEIVTHPSHICSLEIWISMALISTVLSFKMKSNTRYTAVVRHGQEGWPIALLRKVLWVGFAYAVFLYELGMFIYIHEVYAIEIISVLRMVLAAPLLTLIIHSLHQLYVLIYMIPSYKQPDCGSILHVITSLTFNIIMVLHIICMVITSVTTDGSLQLEVGVVAGAMLLGFAELVFRLWVIWVYVVQLKYLKRHFHSHRNQASSVRENREGSDGQLVTGRKDDRSTTQQRDGPSFFNISVPLQERSFCHSSSHFVCNYVIFAGFFLIPYFAFCNMLVAFVFWIDTLVLVHLTTWQAYTLYVNYTV